MKTSFSHLPASCLLAASMLSSLLAGPAAGQQQNVIALREAPRLSVLEKDALGPQWPFPAEESMEYGVRLGRFHLGKGWLRTEGTARIQGQPVYHVSMRLKGGPPFYRVDDYQASWIALQPFRSLQFLQRLKEDDYQRHRKYALKQDQDSFYRYDWNQDTRRFEPAFQAPDGRGVMPQAALDELAFLYYLRTVDLKVGTTYSSNHYFHPKDNPIEFRVLGRKKVRVPAGSFETYVIQPVIPSATIFEEEKSARIYMTTDRRRLIVQLESSTKVGPLQLYLKQYSTGS